MNWRAGILVAVWFLVGVVLYSVIKKWGGDYWDIGTWQVVAAIGTWLLAGSIVFAIVQVQEMRRGRNAQLAAQLYEALRTEKAKKTLELIYQADPLHPKATLSKGKIESILDNLEMLGILVALGIFDKSLAVKTFGGWPIRCWSRLSVYVKQKRKERGHYARYVEDFAKRSIKYQIQHDPKDEWTKLTIEGRKKENLVEDLAKELLSSRERVWSLFIRYLKHPCWLCQEQWPKKRKGQKSTKRKGRNKREV